MFLFFHSNIIEYYKFPFTFEIHIGLLRNITVFSRAIVWVYDEE